MIAGVLALACASSATPAQASLEYLGHFGSAEEFDSGGFGFSVSGDVYAGGDGSVSTFTAGGGYVGTFGLGVADGKEEPESCSASCKPGIISTIAGSVAGGVVASGGTLYVVSDQNQRIDEFSSAGLFLRAFGWGVGKNGTGLETCTSECFEGLAGEEEGHFNQMGSATASGGLLYFERLNRIETWAGPAFDGAMGWGIDGGKGFETCSAGCLKGESGSGAGELEGSTGIAVGDSDIVDVDGSQHRINVFSGGGFADAFGWGVADGKEQFEVCSVTCVRGKEGYGAGELSAPVGVTIEGNDAYVVDRGARRIDEYDLSTSSFVAGYGYGVIDHGSNWEECTTATGCVQGGPGPEFILQEPEAIGSDPGVLYVGDPNAVEILRFAIKGSGEPGPGPGPGAGGGGGGNGGSEEKVEPISAAAVIKAISLHLAPAGAGAKIGALLRHGGLVESVSAPEAGSETIAWYEIPHGAHGAKAKAKPKPLLVAKATAHFAAPGTIKVKVALSAAGKKLLRHSHRLSLTAKATFTPTSGASVHTQQSFSLHR